MQRTTMPEIILLAIIGVIVIALLAMTKLRRARTADASVACPGAIPLIRELKKDLKITF